MAIRFGSVISSLSLAAGKSVRCNAAGNAAETFTAMDGANNLSEISDQGTAQTNLGGTATGKAVFTAANAAAARITLGVPEVADLYSWIPTQISFSSHNLVAADSGKWIDFYYIGGPSVALPDGLSCTTADTDNVNFTRFRLFASGGNMNLIPYDRGGGDVDYIQCVHYGASGNFSTLSGQRTQATTSFLQYTEVQIELWGLPGGTPLWVVTNGAMSYT